MGHTGASRSVVLLAMLAATVRTASGQAPERLFYYIDNEQAFESLHSHIDQVDVIAVNAFKVDADGIVWGEVDPRVLRLAAGNGVRVMPYIAQPGFDQELLHGLLADETARRRAIESLVELCRRHGFWGIQFDFENVSIRDRDAYTRFYEEAATALHGAGFRISMAVVHRPDVLPGPTQYHKWLFRNWRAGYDIDAIARIGDFISVMTYSQHTRRTPPGPNAGVPWVTEVVEYFLERVPAQKLSLGIPTVSQHWYTSQEDGITPELARSYSETVTHARGLALVERNDAELVWSEAHQVPYALYSRGGTFEWVFLEDARSFAAKLDIMDRYDLRGFSVWVLGYEDPGIWQVLEARR